MLPSLVSREIINSVQHFLKTNFPATTPGFLRNYGSDEARSHPRTIIGDFLKNPDMMFKGPHLGLGLPFRKSEQGDSLPFVDFEAGFLPYKHHVEAFKRLCGNAPLSTLVATGTGSGKTECFVSAIRLLRDNTRAGHQGYYCLSYECAHDRRSEAFCSRDIKARQP